MKTLDEITEGLDIEYGVRIDIAELIPFEVFDPISIEEALALAANISQLGIIHDFILWKDNRIIDGNQRMKAMMILREQNPQRFEELRVVNAKRVKDDLDEHSLRKLARKIQAYQRQWKENHEAKAIYNCWLEETIPNMHVHKRYSSTQTVPFTHVSKRYSSAQTITQKDIADIFNCSQQTVSRAIQRGKTIDAIIEIDDDFTAGDLWQKEPYKLYALHEKLISGTGRQIAAERAFISFAEGELNDGTTRLPHKSIMAYLYTSPHVPLKIRVLFKILREIYGWEKNKWMVWKPQFWEQVGILDKGEQHRNLEILKSEGWIHRVGERIYVNEGLIEERVRESGKVYTKLGDHPTLLGGDPTDTPADATESSVSDPLKATKESNYTNKDNKLASRTSTDIRDPSQRGWLYTVGNVEEQASGSQTSVDSLVATFMEVFNQVSEEPVKYKPKFKYSICSFIGMVLSTDSRKLHPYTRKLLHEKYTSGKRCFRKVRAATEDLITRSQEYNYEGQYKIGPWSVGLEWVWEFYIGGNDG